MANLSEYCQLLMFELNTTPSYIGNAFSQAGMHLMENTQRDQLNISLLRQFWTAGCKAADEVLNRDVHPQMPRLISEIGDPAAKMFLHRMIMETRSKMDSTFNIMQLMLYKMNSSNQDPLRDLFSPTPSDIHSYISSSSVVYAEVGGDGTMHTSESFND